jgi:DNA-binding NarL/FixJ family response regulator
VGKGAAAKGSTPSLEQLRRWMRQGPFRKPQGLRLEQPHGANVVVMSFPVPCATFGKLLTDAETAIARDILSGLSNASIARKRGTAVRTIANQVAAIFRKLQVRSRLELSVYARVGRHATPRDNP